MRKFECMLFIDDDFMANYYHKEIAVESDVAEKLLFFTNPIEALNYLENEDDKDYKKPDIIFLDLNMPQMSGWDFMDRYLEIIKEGYSEIVILSDSLNPLYLEKVKNTEWIADFQYKPLSMEYLNMLTNKLNVNEN